MFNFLYSRLPISTQKLALLLVFTLFTAFQAVSAPDGKALFMANCASCHNPYKDATGPALNGVSGRVPSKDWIYKWIKNPAAVISSGDKYANDLYIKWKKTNMTAFPGLSTEEVDAIIAYVELPKPVEIAVTETGKGGATKAESGSNNFMFAIITLVLLLAAVLLSQVNKVLNKNVNDQLGLPTKNSVPVYRNKVYIAIVGVLIAIGSGVYLSNAGVNMGRQKNYMPEQPIYYSHKVHAGINQINCLYCHTGAEKGRHALVPSTNVCMNCHKQIAEYTGAEKHPLVTLEGEKVDGTKEIQKLYAAAGWDPVKKDYIRNVAGEIQAKPIEWVKIHNLPDHVYFNHSLHTVSGKVQCQQCHGGIQEMDEVYQHTDLSMGWCINCHRETKVQFADNNYYKIFQKYHDEIKAGTREDVKVSDIGGLECQKCHY
jgi:cytochrome c2